MAERHPDSIPDWVVTDPDLREAIERFIDHFGQSPVIEAVLPLLSCHEVCLVADVLAAAGFPDGARQWLTHPVHTGQADDEHFGLTANSASIPMPRWMSTPHAERHDVHRVRSRLRDLRRALRKNRP